jgi:hypothetical protein
LIEEDDQYSYRANYSDGPDEEGEEIGADGAVIGEFIADNFHGNYPTYDHCSEETTDREHYLTCEEIKTIEETLPGYGNLWHCTK